MPSDPTKRFSDRVANYMLYRPDYPGAIIPFLEAETGLSNNSIIADIGSGTGKSSAVFLDYGCRVFAVEPNKPMRLGAKAILGYFPNFQSIDGTAENTSLDDHSVDFIVSGQAFHWFDPEMAVKEFRRILIPEGYVILMWNTRDRANAPFMDEYNAFVSNFSDDYKKIYQRRTDVDSFDHFFGKKGYQYHTFPNFQEFSFKALKGRYLSSSYAYNEQHPLHEKAMKALQHIFNKYEVKAKVKMVYKTELYFGKL